MTGLWGFQRGNRRRRSLAEATIIVDLLIITGQHDRAIEDYNKAIALNPNYAEAYYNRGNAYYFKGQYDRAIEEFNKAIALNPNDATAYNNRGLAYGKKGHYDRAISDFQRACDMGNEKGCKNLQWALQKR
jgi:tetratricopeptide (TPR) repeat protein